MSSSEDNSIKEQPLTKRAKLDNPKDQTEGELDAFEDVLFDGTTRPQDLIKPYLDGLIPYVNDTANHTDELYHEDKACVVVRDTYNKARCHMLVIPKRSIDEPKCLTTADLPLLQHIHERSLWVIAKMKRDHPELRDVGFRAGIHAIPSVRQLHIHVISQDFDSERLKNKKHWNSFTTEYFIDTDELLAMLKAKGEVKVDSEKVQAALKRDMKCHVCDQPLRNIPLLKKHIKTHLPASMTTAQPEDV
ncbi:hypothetical protein SARC_04789 [Sphaeroforma arctica JP610]|uniref:C2H2-type domain-containing protein n=1 Tax=Sphaeroforma arctica JP610 TaxID=667725 RepID=A0A0L0G1B2_9EUKA|nr:hypothetical protein SARC_04789 [Sphaeroforma arctica JP610]KNC82942.1 hypothetical protein SARC_04789 [Sphaeroforma arctica JP610]|eukprot:XP_014156844.1 hypothetical protein SARC_04789 [Sphaeroforma arctica JP610]